MTDKPTLKPCPFCGGEANVRTVEFVGCEYVKCEKCGVSSDDHGKGSARTAWNTRAATKVKALEWDDMDEKSFNKPAPFLDWGRYEVHLFRSDWCLGEFTYPSREAAKAAAQADFDRRILDALE